MTAGSRMLRITVASTNTATARPRPSCWRIENFMVTKTEKTTTMIAGGARDCARGDRDAASDRAARIEAAVATLLDPGEDEEVVVHRESVDDREDEERYEALDDRTRGDPQGAGEPAVLEDERHEPVGRGGREQVERDGRGRDDDRAEGDEQQEEREAEHEGEHERHSVG